MREIKFRGKVVNHDPMTNPENGWVEGYYLQDLDNGVVKHYIFNCPMKWEVTPETIGQFTGLHDYDGKEIFEGDIVKCCYMIPEWGWSGGAEEKEEEVIGAVEYCRGDFCIGEYPIVGFQENEMEDIGNIYDNPELLKSL